MNRIDNYFDAKSKIQTADIEGIGVLDKLLCTDTWNLDILSYKDKFIRVCGILISDVIQVSHLFDSVQDSFSIGVEISYPHTKPRLDNQMIFDNLYAYLRPATHIHILKNYKMKPLRIFRKAPKLFSYRKYFRNLRAIDSFYLAAQLLVADELSKKCDFLVNKKLLLIFQEDDLISSTIIQAAQRKGVCVIAPQHGMPMNRYEDIDQLHFEGFLADYKLLWNEATKEQFLSAGIDDDRLVVVGNTKKIDESNNIREPKKNDFIGVILDCPDYSYAIDANMIMLSMANQLAYEMDLKLIVKAHPRDSLNRYKPIIKDDELLPLNASMDEFAKLVSISIGHTTGAIFDLIYDGKIVFQYVDDKRFPVETLECCKFKNITELIDNYGRWSNNWEAMCKSYIEKVVPRYHVMNARELHDEFFTELFNAIRKNSRDGEESFF